MNLKYSIEDEGGNIIKSWSSPQGSIATVQGETKTLTVLLYNQDGTPFTFPNPTDLQVNVFSTITQATIQKKMSVSSGVILVAGNGGNIGFKFTLQPADTTSMAANNAGLPMSAIITSSDVPAKISEVDFPGAFGVTALLVGNTSQGD